MTRRGLPVLLAALVVGAAVAGLAPGVAAADGPEFEKVIVVADHDETAAIPMTVPGDDPVRVSVGSEDVNFRVTASVVDADGDGSVVLRLDASAAGAGDPGSYLSVSDGDDLRNATQHTDDIEPPLAGGDYDLSLGPDDDPADVATLVLEEPSDDRPNRLNRTDDDRSTTTLSVDGTTLVYEGDELELEAAADRVVHGETHLDAGTEVTVRLRSTGKSPFLETADATVTEYGTFEATFDLSDVSPNTTFEASVRGDGRRLAVVPGRVVDCDGGCPTPSERDEAATGELPADEIAVASHAEVTQAHTAEIPVTLGDADAVTVVVGGDAVNYEATGVVRDRDGDSRVVVEFHTDRAGFDAPTLSAHDGGSPRAVETQSESSLPQLLAAGDYPVRVYRGTSADGDPAAVGSLVVYEAPDAVGSATTTTTVAPPANDTGGDDDGNDADENAVADASRVSGLGAIALGGVLAVVGVGVVFGLFRR